MTTRLMTSTAVCALAVLCGAWPSFAQDAAPGAATPSPGAAQPTLPSATTTPPTTAPAGDGQQLPDVEVIQEQPKPQTAEPAAKPKKKPAPVASAAKPKPAAQLQPELVEGPPAIPAATTYALPPGPSTVKMSPVGGSEIPVEKVPGGVTSVTASDVKRDGSVNVQDTLNSRVPGVIVGDLQGNAFQTNVQYRGFESSPVNGVPQGLAIYQNGVRINESFGDIVNWDFLPTNAINGLTVMSGNPVFGLNAIGGAISIDMKDGFSYQGGEVDVRFGSFGRKQIGVEAGGRSGAVSAYIAAEGIDDDGFRDFSEAEVRRIYGDLGAKGDGSEFHINFTGAKNFVGVTAAAPEELLEANGRSRTFTSPQTTDNDLAMVSLNGSVKANETLSFSGVTYYRRFKQKHDDGNIADAEECEDPAYAGLLCIEEGVAFGQGPGVNPDGTINFDLNGNGLDDELYGSIDRTSQDANSYGIALQAVEKSPLFNLPNQFTIGASYDHGRVAYTANSQLGLFAPRFVVVGTGINFTAQPDGSPIDEDDVADDVFPRDLTTLNDYYGLYFTNTTDLNDRLALTLGGRFNHARIEIKENTGEDELASLNGVNTFNRFNPSAGLTYKISSGLSVYGGYSEANRAPTPAEIACSDPLVPCIIESFLTADPPLKQVVSHTVELGVRGKSNIGWQSYEQLEWGVGLFRTLNTDDIISVADETSNGRGYFLNAGDTLRQGVEASIAYRSQRLFAYASYAYIDATFRDSLNLSSPDNPIAEECDDGAGGTIDDSGCIQVNPGDRLAGIPRHRLKLGFDYYLTPEWKFGADMIAASSQIFFGDEGNDNRPLAGYTKVNLHSSYDVTKNVQVYGLIENLTDNEYGVYGTYFNVDAANVGGAADTPPITFDEDGEHRSITPAIPFAAYGGVKVKF